ncbi:hypothetical protein AFULGI_00016410 [Archaeoglobus fulgidus DSM 8774]|uniref:Uncharacterized protein n=1 Tax=Archaeoglobus fulgidus DSM 8774 TaxID=1344584 RepID=A0A075WD93_ARCFL|nr:hypothetical protein [Archaeoglobus fulgidus]AIG98400.1 hypothetical protein AFULGI_00016410 [Archaeoglobus fulgidus DSM 8774]
MKIDEIKKKYKDEWVLIKVLKVDEFGTPVKGEVIAHSKSRGEIYEKQRRMKGDLAIIYTGEIPKVGYALAEIY